MQIFIAKNGTQKGPFTEEQIRDMVSVGLISHDDLAWIHGESNWKPLHSVLGLSQPPPILKTPFPEPSATTTVIPTYGPKGVGGWLLFFCVSLTILGPLFSLGRMVNGWQQVQPIFSEFPLIKSAIIWENFGSGIILFYGFIVGCLIWNGSPQGRNIARQFLLVRFFGFIGIGVITTIVISSLSSEVMENGVRVFIKGVFQEMLYFLIWWLYFKKSRRVCNAYGHEGG